MQENDQKKSVSSSLNYFDENTEKAIIAFQKEPSIAEKQKIFVSVIQPSFAKLIENIIYVYRFHSLGEIEILKNDCLSFLFENLYKFDGTRGHKAFSYFNVMAKHWFIQKVKNSKKKNESDIHFDKDLLHKLEQNENEAVFLSYEDGVLKKEYLTNLADEIRRWRGKFDKEQERKVLEAVILLLENPDLIPIYNKKGIYLYIREITGLNTKQVVTNLSKLRRKYELYRKRYFNGDS